MATSGSVNSGGYQGRVLQFSWNTQSINSATNVRTISYTITAVGGSSSKYYHHNNTVSINDTNVYSGGTSDYITTNTVLKTGTFSINQSSTTTLTVKMNGGIYVYSDNINTTQSWTLDTIPRYTTITTFSVDKVSETSLKINWQTADVIDYAYYSTDNGATWAGHDVTDGTSGNFTISKLSSNTSTNLSANTKYNCKLRVRRKDSQLNTDSGTVAQTTYDYPYCTNTPNFLIGDSVTLTFYNPLSRNIKIELIGANNVVCDTTNITGTSISGYNGSATISNLYATIPNSNSGKYKVRVTYGSSVKTRENNNTYTIKANSSNPTFSNFDYADTNTTTTNLTGNPLILVKGYSNNKITIGTDKKATAKNSATMKTYKVVQGNKTSGDLTYSSSAAVTATLNAIDNNVITVSATDSRGNSTSVTKTLNSTYYKTYSPIAITSVSATRSNNGVGKIVTLKLNGTYWNNSFGTTTNDIINARYQYKVASSSGSFSSEKTLSLTKSGANFSYNGTIEGDLGAEGFSVENSFIVRIRIQDRLQEKNYDITLGPGSPAIAIYKGNVAIGQKYDTSEGYKFQLGGVGINTPLGHRGNAPSNLNNAIKPGTYRLGDTYTNAPRTDAIYGELIVWVSTGAKWTASDMSAWIWQEIRDTSNRIYQRNAVNSDTWNSWVLVSTNGKANTATNTTIESTNPTSGTTFLIPFVYGTNSEFLHRTNDGLRYYTVEGTSSTKGVGELNVGNGISSGTAGNKRGHIRIFSEKNGSNYVKAVEGITENFWNYLPQHTGYMMARTQLYNNTSGTTGTVTLSETAANFAFFDILYGKQSDLDKSIRYNTARIYNPNGKKANLTLFYRATSNIIQHIAADIAISEKSITKSYYHAVNLTTAGFSNIDLTTDNSITIFRVDGYR